MYDEIKISFKNNIKLLKKKIFRKKQMAEIFSYFLSDYQALLDYLITFYSSFAESVFLWIRPALVSCEFQVIKALETASICSRDLQFGFLSLTD